MKIRALGPGPEVGRVIEALREAQAAGDVTTLGEAEAFVRAWREGT
jgi:hypothetical protein